MVSEETMVYYNDYYRYERVPFQLQPNTLPSLRELFFNTELSMPEFAGFVSYVFLGFNVPVSKLTLPKILIVFQMSSLQQQRLIVEQLRREAAIKRINVSQAVEEIKVPICT